MPLNYTKSDGIGRKIVPAPIVTINKNYISNDNGEKIGSNYQLSLRGTLVAHRGSPSGNYSTFNNAFWTLSGDPPDQSLSDEDVKFNSILRKQEALRWLFNEDGASLEWQPGDGSPVVKCNPKVLSIDFDEGQWVDRCDYTIQLETPWLYINGTLAIEDTIASDLISSASETWSFEETEGRNGQSYVVSHEVNAVGFIGYDENGDLQESKTAWQHAQDYVTTRIAGVVDTTIMSAAVGATNWLGGSYTKNTNVDENTGSFSVRETWILMPSNTFTEKTFNVNHNVREDSYTVRYDGVIFGIENGQRSGSSAALNQAKNAMPSNALALSDATSNIGTFLNGQSLPSTPNVKTIVTNQQEGTVTFSFEWVTSSDGETYTESVTASLNFNEDGSLYTMSLTQNVEGMGATETDRLDNAKAAILSNSQAYTRALQILGSAIIPTGTNLTSTIRSKGSTVDESRGSVRTSWSWDNTRSDSLEINTNTQFPSNIIASIGIPGRTAGPVIQDMGTVTSKIITVSIRGKNQATKPDGESLALPFSEDGTKIGDVENYNETTKSYERVIRYLIET